MAVAVQIYPKDDAKGRSFGLIIYKSSKVVVGVEAPIVVFLPGIGGKGNGTQTELEAVDKGEVPSQFKEGLEKYGFVCVVVQSNSSYSLGEPKFARDWGLANLPADKNRKYLTGLSWGGGGTAGEPLVSLEDAKLFDAIAPIAMTWQNATSVKCKYITDANLAVWAFHNLKDPNGGTPPAATESYVDAINALNPKVRATKTMFESYPVHGGWGEAYNADKIPIAAGSTGMITPACNLYEWLLMNNSITRVAVPSTTTQPIPPIVVPPPITVKPITSFIISGSKVALIGSKSIGYTEGYDGTWTFISGPEGVTTKQVFPNGSSYIDATGQLPVQGTYLFQFNLKGADPVQVTVQMGAVVTKIPVSFANGKLTFTDNTSESATAIFTTASGRTYSL